jgi:hypothetical protein
VGFALSADRWRPVRRPIITPPDGIANRKRCAFDAQWRVRRETPSAYVPPAMPSPSANGAASRTLLPARASKRAAPFPAMRAERRASSQMPMAERTPRPTIDAGPIRSASSHGPRTNGRHGPGAGNSTRGAPTPQESGPDVTFQPRRLGWVVSMRMAPTPNEIEDAMDRRHHPWADRRSGAPGYPVEPAIRGSARPRYAWRPGAWRRGVTGQSRRRKYGPSAGGRPRTRVRREVPGIKWSGDQSIEVTCSFRSGRPVWQLA